jgi:hypothetical protein
MSSKYFSVEYTGTYLNIQTFLTTRDWNSSVKNVGGYKVFIKLSENFVEELLYMREMDIDDLKGGKINLIKEISESEFQNFSENGFEIIHDHHHENKLTPEGNSKKEPETNTCQGISLNQQRLLNLNSDVHGEKCETTQEQQSAVEETKEEISERVARALTDTILPSKSPLPENDPFVYLTSPGYLKSFFFVSTMIIFVLALLD